MSSLPTSVAHCSPPLLGTAHVVYKTAMQRWQEEPLPHTDTREQPPLAEDAALRALVEGIEAETGDRFFYSLVRHLAAAHDDQEAHDDDVEEEDGELGPRRGEV